jgi:hypothetical protein
MMVTVADSVQGTSLEVSLDAEERDAVFHAVSSVYDIQKPVLLKGTVSSISASMKVA